MTEQADFDLTGLPLFNTHRPSGEVPEGRRSVPGRVRGEFTLKAVPPLTRPAAAVPFATPRAAVGEPRHDGAALDWALVAAFRAQASEQLTRALGEDRGQMSRQEQQELGRSIVTELLDAAAAESVTRGERAWTPERQRQLADAVFDALFRLGRLQRLVDDDSIENIIITGCDRVVLERADGTKESGPPVAESDQELIDFLGFLASRSEVNARPFSEAQPSLHLRLDGGARLAATAWVTPRPSVVIRRHRLQQVTLGDLVRRGTLTPLIASFLAAAVRARLSIVVSGAQGAGKTTMVRALCAEIPPHEDIGTFESEYELHLHEMPEQHPIVHAWEARPGSGERGADGRLVGEYSMAAQIMDSFRFFLDRQIVGEVRGPEVWSMIKVMESGSGSISTTHSRDGESAMRKLVTCAMEAGSHVTQELATSKLADTIDLIVHLHAEAIPGEAGVAGRKDRWVAEVLYVSPGEREKGYALTHVFRRVTGRPATAHVLPDELRSLAEDGFDLAGFVREAEGGH